jgi:hypothetical protein
MKVSSVCTDRDDFTFGHPAPYGCCMYLDIAIPFSAMGQYNNWMWLSRADAITLRDHLTKALDDLPKKPVRRLVYTTTTGITSEQTKTMLVQTIPDDTAGAVYPGKNAARRSNGHMVWAVEKIHFVVK